MKNPKLFEPLWRDGVVIGHCSDITLLDLLAGFALAGIMASPESRDEIEKTANVAGESIPEALAKSCCGAALAVLRELNKEREGAQKGAKS